MCGGFCCIITYLLCEVIELYKSWSVSSVGWDQLLQACMLMVVTTPCLFMHGQDHLYIFSIILCTVHYVQEGDREILRCPEEPGSLVTSIRWEYYPSSNTTMSIAVSAGTR